MPRDTFSARLVLIRHEVGTLSQANKIEPVEAISARCGIKPATWSTWERGAKPQDMAEVAKKIEAGTGYDRDWLMWGGSMPSYLPLSLVGPAIGQLDLPFEEALDRFVWGHDLAHRRRLAGRGGSVAPLAHIRSRA